MDTYSNQWHARGSPVSDHNKTGQVHKKKPTFKVGIPTTTSTTLKEPRKFFPDSTQDCKHHPQHQFSE
jgi:hypothetical protein